MDTDETDEEVQDTGPALDDDLDSEVDDFTIEEDDCVFMAMLHPVNPHHFVRCGERCPSAFNSFELPSWMLYQDIQLLWDSGLVRGESGYSL
jgi:hypothetical protein